MEIKNNKELYEAPSMMIVEVKQEGVICASTDIDPIADPFSGNDELLW